MDLKVNCKKIEIDGYDCGYKTISIFLDTIYKLDLDTPDVAECVSFNTFFDTWGEDAIRAYVENNYDWFDKDEQS